MADWEPGDPLYARPKPGTGSQHIRPLLEVLAPESKEHVIARQPGFCAACEVSSTRPDCWFCGQPTALKIA